MKTINDHLELPFKIKIGFKKLIDHYVNAVKDVSDLESKKIDQLLEIVNQHPELTEGVTVIEDLLNLKDEITLLLQDFFSPILALNEIKIASTIFYNDAFCGTARFKNIIKSAGEDFKLELVSIPKNDQYLVACAIILNSYYKYDVNFRRPFYYEIPNEAGLMKTYKILYNADFVNITKNENAPDINEQDFKHLIDNFSDIKLWQEKFPINSYDFNGFVIANMFDVTEDQAISNMKTSLIATNNQEKDTFVSNFQDVFRALLNVPDLSVGFSVYNTEDETLVNVFDSSINSFLLQKEASKSCHSLFCNHSFKELIENNSYYSLSNIDETYQKSKGKSPQIATLYKQGIKSDIFAPIVDNGNLLGVLELVSNKPFELHSFKAYKLLDVMPFIKLSVKRSREEEKNLIQAIIQKECTSIHPSVQWKFEQAARLYMMNSQRNKEKVVFNRIDFKSVYPLYGQSDIVNSSHIRNEATAKDLTLQLKLVQQILEAILLLDSSQLVEQFQFKIQYYFTHLKKDLQVNTEQEITNFLQNDIEPYLNNEGLRFLSVKNSIEYYFEKLDNHLKVVYYYRKNFDDSVMAINEDVSSLLDFKQKEVQVQYPHFFERFKTDGVEHNMYIGESITKEDSFSVTHLYNLRLWQLQAMCQSEMLVSNNTSDYPLDLQIASMILVFSQPLSINFRFDEKHFDVDGTYNARYEVVKKRIDKSLIKGTQERATMAGKITIMYSHKEDAKEYINYITFLQSEGFLNDDLECLELENLQGVQGLKAIRVGVNYSMNTIENYFTYSDMLKSIDHKKALK